MKKKEDSLEFIKENALKNMVFKHFNVLANKTIKEPFFYFINDPNIYSVGPNTLSIAENKETPIVLEGELLSRWDLLEHAFEQTNNTRLARRR